MSGYVAPATALFIVLAFIVLLRLDHRRKKNGKKEWPMPTPVGRAGAAGGLAPALFLIYGSFNPTDLCKWPGLPGPLALGAACLFYLSFKAAFKEEEEDDLPSKAPTDSK